MTKVDLITGFLGSGKTTFIKKYVRYLLDKGEKVGIIENDYGAINVDMLLLDSEFGDECRMEMVVAADPDCHRRRFKTKLIAMGMESEKLDHVIVEPSGIYDVDEFFDILYEEPLDRFYEIGNVIAIVDSGLSDELSKESDYLLVSQIAEAGMVVFSKMDNEVSNDVENVIAHMNKALDRFKCDRRYDKASKDIMIKSWENLTADDFERIEKCGYVPEDHIKLHVAEDNGYKSLFYYHAKMTEDGLKRMAEGLFADKSLGNIYRVKGFVPIDDNGIDDGDGLSGAEDEYAQTAYNKYIQINATSERVEITHTDNGQEVIIVIGEGLDNGRIEDYIREYSFEKDITAGQSNHRHAGS
ncbi:MAG: GTPase (G3E family) [Lachnospiraceae bacterium]|nr:GTPase (G3E family) [Lachnospiraceae bacterium]